MQRFFPKGKPSLWDGVDMDSGLQGADAMQDAQVQFNSCRLGSWLTTRPSTVLKQGYI